MRFDGDAFAEDLAQSAADRAVAQQERARLQRDGIAAAALLCCDVTGRALLQRQG